MDKFKLEDRVTIVGKNASGKLAYIGKTHFSDGEWFGVILDEAKGRNNGSIDGKFYFKCPRNHGIFVRSCQLEPEFVEENAEKCSKTSKVRYPDYLSKCIKRKSHKSADKSNSGNEERNESNILQDVHPMNSVIKDFEDIFNRQSKELSEIKEQKKETEANLKKVGSEVQIIVGELNKQTGVEITLRKELAEAQRIIEVLKIKLSNTEKKLEISERKRHQLGSTVQDFRDITESAVIEKEISEERSEQFEMVMIDEVNKCKNLEIEIQIMKEEMQLQCIDGVPATHFLKELKHQNAVLSNALHQLRDMYQNLRQQLLVYEKSVEKDSNEIKSLKAAQISMKQAICAYKGEVSELCDSIDTMMDADDVVFDVTERNLDHEERISHLSQVLQNAEKQLEVCEEVEHTLEEIKSVCEEEIECLASKVKHAQVILEQQMFLIKRKDEIISKYKVLTTTLKEKNSRLTYELEKISKERKEAVIQAENLKLEIHRDRRKNLKDIIETENMKISLEIYKQELNYWSLFMPEGFFERGGENYSVRMRLILSDMVKKLDLLLRLVEMSHEKYDSSNPEELKSLTAETKFLISACQLQAVLKIYARSFDLANTEFFITLNKYYDLFVIKKEEIERYLTFLCENEIDTKSNIDRIRNTYSTLSQLPEIKCIPKEEETHIHLECYLKVALICCKCVSSYCSALDIFDGCALEDKNRSKQLFNVVNKIKIHARSIHFSITNNEAGKFHFSQVVEEKVNSNRNLTDDVMDNLSSIHSNIFDKIEELGRCDSRYVPLSEIISKLAQVEVDLEKFRQGINYGEYSIESNKDNQSLSSIHRWAQRKKLESEGTINVLKSKTAFYEKEISKLSQQLETKKKEVNKVKNKVLRDISQQTEELEENINLTCSDDKSSSVDYLKFQLNDFKCLVKFLHEKNSKLMEARMKIHQGILTPLKVIPKPLYQSDIHNLCTLNKRLNKISVDLRGIIVPLVVDITSKSKCNGRRYFKYMAERTLILQGIKEELWSINVEVKKLKNSHPICLKRNPFSVRNIRMMG